MFYIFRYLGGLGGGGDFNITAAIMSYNSTDDSWKKVGKMIEPRTYFAIGILPDVDKICS